MLTVAKITRDPYQRRHPRGGTVWNRPATLAERRSWRRTHYPAIERPKCRADCADGPRPCPWVSCKWHLYLDVEGARLRLNWPPETPLEYLPHTCALDLADTGPHTLESLALALNLTRERVRQIEAIATRKAHRRYAEVLR